MNNRIQRSQNAPIREGLTWKEKWSGPDDGLIACWENGRKMREKKPDLASRTENDELPPLSWKGGVEELLKKKNVYGTLRYLAEWQGLRGEDLDIDLAEERELVCSKTGMVVIYTNDPAKYNGP